MINCIECGFEFDETLGACPECGCPIVSESNNKAENDLVDSNIGNTKKKPNKKFIGIVCAVSLIVIILVAVLLYIKSIQVKSVMINGDVNEIQVDDEFDLSYSVSPEKAKIKNISWESSDASVASVQDGHVVAHKSGECTISVEINSKVKAEYPITVISLEELQQEALAKLVTFVEENSDCTSDGVSMITVGSVDQETTFFIGSKGKDIYLVNGKEPKENSQEISCKYTTYVVIESGNIESASFKQYNTIDVMGYKANSTGDGTISFDSYKIGNKVNIDSFKSTLDKVDGVETGVTDDFQKLADNGVKNDFEQLKKFLEDNDEIGCSLDDLQLTTIY